MFDGVFKRMKHPRQNNEELNSSVHNSMTNHDKWYESFQFSSPNSSPFEWHSIELQWNANLQQIEHTPFLKNMCFATLGPGQNNIVHTP